MGLIKKRFDAVVEEDYTKLVQLWQKDTETAKKKAAKRQPRATTDEDEEKERKARQAVSLISKGQISKASNRMLSNGVASLDNAQSLDALKAKYPQRGRPMQPEVTKGRAVESMMGLRNCWF